MISRRQWLITLGASSLTSSFSAFAQPQGKVWRIGYMSIRAESGLNEEIFRQGLRDVGLVEGQNVAIEWRNSSGSKWTAW
jgi:putative tryptophan/tyrosine transport system substrate-binding protein